MRHILDSVSNRVQFEKSAELEPDKALWPNSKTLNDVIFHNSVGIDPDSKFPPHNKKCRPVSVPKPDGIEPSRLLYPRFRVFRNGNAPKFEGIVLERLLPDKPRDMSDFANVNDSSLLSANVRGRLPDMALSSNVNKTGNLISQIFSATVPESLFAEADTASSKAK